MLFINLFLLCPHCSFLSPLLPLLPLFLSFNPLLPPYLLRKGQASHEHQQSILRQFYEVSVISSEIWGNRGMEDWWLVSRNTSSHSQVVSALKAGQQWLTKGQAKDAPQGKIS